MKTPTIWILSLTALSASSLAAQSVGTGQPAETLLKERAPGFYSQADWQTAESSLAESAPIVAGQNLGNLSLDATPQEKPNAQSVLKNPSPFRRLLVSTQNAADIPSEELRNRLAAASATYRVEGDPAEEEDCQAIHHTLSIRIAQKRQLVLEIVAEEVAAHPSCVCEIVKTAISASEADAETVAAIVETVSMVDPAHMRMASQCAIAAAPDAVAAVQGVLARLERNSGEGSSAKSGKDDLVENATEKKKGPNPLDRVFADHRKIDQHGGDFSRTPDVPFIPIPPVIVPPEVTGTN